MSIQVNSFVFARNEYLQFVDCDGGTLEYQ